MGDEHRAFARDFRIFRGHLRDFLVDIINQIFAFVGHPKTCGIQTDHFAPVRGPRTFPIGNYRGDHAQRVIFRTGQSGICSQNNIGLAGRDGLEIDAIAFVKKNRNICSEFIQLLGHPRQNAVPVGIPKIRPCKADRHNPQSKGHFVIGPGNRRDAFRLCLDHSSAKGMINRHRELLCRGACRKTDH